MAVPGTFPQAFTAATVIFPVTKVPAKFTVIALVPAPLANVPHDFGLQSAPRDRPPCDVPNHLNDPAHVGRPLSCFELPS